MKSTLFIPFSVIGGLLAGLVAKKAFEGVWGLIDDEEPPDSEHREVSYPKMAAALALEGAIFAVAKGFADHQARRGFERFTGEWPGDEEPEEE